MGEYDSFREIIDLWPSRVALADELGVRPQAIANMHMRDSVASEHFNKIVEAAKSMGYDGVTHELMCNLAARGREAVG